MNERVQDEILRLKGVRERKIKASEMEQITWENFDFNAVGKAFTSDLNEYLIKCSCIWIIIQRFFLNLHLPFFLLQLI